jgi:hypothetical protein
MKKHLFPLFLLLISANASAQQDFFALSEKIHKVLFSMISVQLMEQTELPENRFLSRFFCKVFSQGRNGV